MYRKGIKTLNVKAQTILGVHSDSLAQTFSHKSVKTSLEQVQNSLDRNAKLLGQIKNK